MVVDGRRLLRALALAVVMFLFVGGGVGFVVAASDGTSGVAVPEPRPGDRAVYSVTKTLLPDLELGDDGDIMLDEVAYEWLPERTVTDRHFVQRLTHPLQATYIFRWQDQETRYLRETDYDAVTGEAVHQAQIGGYTQQPLLLPGVIGQVGAGIDTLLQPPTNVSYEGDYYDYFLREPCAQRSALHGAAGTPASLDLGACGWPGVDDPAYVPVGWDDLPTGRAFHYGSPGEPRLGVWFDAGSPFPAKVTASMREIVDPAWTIGRLFTLERAAWAAGEGSYPIHEESAVHPFPSPNPIDLVPRTTPWQMDDEGLGGDLSLARAYQEAQKAPRVVTQDPAGLSGPEPRPSVREWLAAHPDGYLADAERYESTDRYGDRYATWVLLWVDGAAWLGKRVSWEPSVGEGILTSVFVPDEAGYRIVVRDWQPRTDAEMPSLVLTFPPKEQLPAMLPRGRAVADQFLAGSQPTFYGFRLWCPDPDCDAVKAYIWAGASSSTFDPNTGATGGDASQDQLSVDEHGLALLRYRQTRESAAVLGLGAPSPEETPPTAATASGPGAWQLPSAPAAATGIGLLAVLTGLLYYFWPALKAGPLVGLFSRIRGDRVLEHPQRARLLDAIQADPGVHFQELARRLGLGHGALDHHLRKLMDADLVVLRRAPGYTCYFPKATDRRVMDAAPVLRSGGSRMVLGAVADKPGVSSRDLASHLGLAPSTVSYHLKRLETAGLVLPDPRAGVRLTPLGEQAKAAA